MLKTLHEFLILQPPSLREELTGDPKDAFISNLTLYRQQEDEVSIYYLWTSVRISFQRAWLNLISGFDVYAGGRFYDTPEPMQSDAERVLWNLWKFWRTGLLLRNSGYEPFLNNILSLGTGSLREWLQGESDFPFEAWIYETSTKQIEI